MPVPRLVRRLGYAVAAVVVLQLLILAGVYWAMCQPPRTFGRIMKHVPMPMMIAVPFRPMWYSAREGALKPGDAAPDFELASADKQRVVRLSELRGRPVVLIFGSYT